MRNQILAFLDAQNSKYAIISHSPAYTAQEVAASAHIPGKDMVKVVVVRIDSRFELAAVPATQNLDVEQLRIAAGAREVTIASEREFAHRFSGCQIGAMPPLGDLFGMTTYMERALAKEPYIAFNAGTHSDVIAMTFHDYRKAAHPRLAHIAFPAPEFALQTAQI